MLRGWLVFILLSAAPTAFAAEPTCVPDPTHEDPLACAELAGQPDGDVCLNEKIDPKPPLEDTWHSSSTCVPCASLCAASVQPDTRWIAGLVTLSGP